MTAEAPLFRVVHGHPSGEETAALAVVLAAKLAAGPPAGDGPARHGAASRWADRARSMCAPLTPGPDAWRRSSQPR
jgi:acyl-CoA carboxylase epsilon subunit